MKCYQCNKQASYKIFTENGMYHITTKYDLYCGDNKPYCSKHAKKIIKRQLILQKLSNNVCGKCEQIYNEMY